MTKIAGETPGSRLISCESITFLAQKKKFEHAHREATKAFANEALKPSDRVLAMQYRVMATI